MRAPFYRIVEGEGSGFFFFVCLFVLVVFCMSGLLHIFIVRYLKQETQTKMPTITWLMILWLIRPFFFLFENIYNHVRVLC